VQTKHIHWVHITKQYQSAHITKDFKLKLRIHFTYLYKWFIFHLKRLRSKPSETIISYFFFVFILIKRNLPLQTITIFYRLSSPCSRIIFICVNKSCRRKFKVSFTVSFNISPWSNCNFAKFLQFYIQWNHWRSYKPRKWFIFFNSFFLFLVSYYIFQTFTHGQLP
jgi:hypothetical protein